MSIHNMSHKTSLISYINPWTTISGNTINFQIMKKIKRIGNELTQYGITPSKLLGLLLYHDTPKVLANSIPKSGTNLLLRTLYLFPQMRRKIHKTLNSNFPTSDKIIKGLKNGQFCSAHLKYSKNIQNALESNNVRHIIIIRDPRDIAVSNCMYITYKDTSHRLSHYFLNNLGDDNERIMASIEGIPANKLNDGIESLSLATHYSGYMAWKEDPKCLFVKFEDIIGEKGGGSKNTQRLCVKKIASHIGLEVTDRDIENVAKRVFNPSSRTFVKGQIGTWKQTLNKDHIAKLKETIGDTIVQLGYEKNENW